MSMHPRGSFSRNARGLVTQENRPTLVNGRERKRTQVACARCRKRKIKCTGISVDGCSNCKSHGIPATHCVVMRAGSTKVLELMPEAEHPTSIPQRALPHMSMATQQDWRHYLRDASGDSNGGVKEQSTSLYTYNHPDSTIDSCSMQSVSVGSQFEDGTYGAGPSQAAVTSVHGSTTRLLPTPVTIPRLPPMAAYEIRMPSPHGLSYKGWSSWSSGSLEGYSEQLASRPSYIPDNYEDMSETTSGGFANTASPPCLLPTILAAPSNGNSPQTDGGYAQYSATQSSLYGLGPYYSAEYEQQRLTSLTMA